jgi:hypothetical protein
VFALRPFTRSQRRAAAGSHVQPAFSRRTGPQPGDSKREERKVTPPRYKTRERGTRHAPRFACTPTATTDRPPPPLTHPRPRSPRLSIASAHLKVLSLSLSLSNEPTHTYDAQHQRHDFPRAVQLIAPSIREATLARSQSAAATIVKGLCPRS